MMYPIRRVPEALWARFTARCKREGRTALAVLHRLIAEYVQHGLRKDS